MTFLLLLFACRDYEALCNAGDPSVSPSTCFRKGRTAGMNDGNADVYQAAYDQGYAACLDEMEAE